MVGEGRRVPEALPRSAYDKIKTRIESARQKGRAPLTRTSKPKTQGVKNERITVREGKKIQEDVSCYITG